MTLLVDTNVLVSALLARGTCADLVEHCVRTHRLVSSQPLLDEFMDVLVRKFGQRRSDGRAAVRLFAEKFLLVTALPLEAPVCRDRDDDIVLGTALAGECDAIVTGDDDLLILESFKGIRIVSPSAFWKWELEASKSG